jgi:hypothetical protein
LLIFRVNVWGCVECREREEMRAAARAKETDAEARLREVNTSAAELRAKLRPVDEYEASDKDAQLKRAAAGLEASKHRLAANEDKVKARLSAPALMLSGPPLGPSTALL